MDIEGDRFQWFFEPQCERYFNQGHDWMMKRYYRDHAAETALELLPRVRTFAEWMAANQSVDIVDDGDRQSWSHMVSVPADPQFFDFPIPSGSEERLSQIWQQNVYISSSVESLQSLSNHRPLLVTMSGEAFDAWRILKNGRMHGQGTDVHIQRTRSWPRPGCIGLNPFIFSLSVSTSLCMLCHDAMRCWLRVFEPK